MWPGRRSAAPAGQGCRAAPRGRQAGACSQRPAEPAGLRVGGDGYEHPRVWEEGFHTAGSVGTEPPAGAAPTAHPSPQLGLRAVRSGACHPASTRMSALLSGSGSRSPMPSRSVEGLAWALLAWMPRGFCAPAPGSAPGGSGRLAASQAQPCTHQPGGGDRHSSASCSLWPCPRRPGALLRGWGCAGLVSSAPTLGCWLCSAEARGPSQAWSIHTQPAGCRQRAKPVSLCFPFLTHSPADPAELLTGRCTHKAPQTPLGPEKARQ